MATYKQLQDQIKQLQHEAEELRKNELSNAIAQIKMTMAEYGITLADLGFTNKKKNGQVSEKLWMIPQFPKKTDLSKQVCFFIPFSFTWFSDIRLPDTILIFSEQYFQFFTLFRFIPRPGCIPSPIMKLFFTNGPHI